MIIIIIKNNNIFYYIYIIISLYYIYKTISLSFVISSGFSNPLIMRTKDLGKLERLHCDITRIMVNV